ncbi:MAG: redox-regulated ATPase YchF [Candidatus Pacebacteria bacterium CG_4_10_14_0_8_um_filter_43_12]|nr:MAG: redox-regulated ATPase YchF [Candidatus Pacebacteria bacterium CG10_big_fil_rev_8_21_14_0_10_44_11]PIY79084.1 MAG: redox-regulated ATPase YchF [Candidatus Pacebacteria bacterium CG_4_10_14_0_8_um_filter_43_12]
MPLSIAIVGLPNVGKSTLFNALLKEQQALAANYPFATIEPNVGVVPVPDSRLEKLAPIVHTSTLKPATVEFVDIAGLVAGASKGEGLGNQFLSYIRETSAICHVIRAFEDSDIIREGSTDPINDLRVIRLELQLADLATLQKQAQPKGAADREFKERWQVIQAFTQTIEQEQPIFRTIKENSTGLPTEFLEKVAKDLNLLTAKDELFVVNVSEGQLQKGAAQLTQDYAKELSVMPDQIIVMCNKIESELASLSDEDRQLYLHELGLEQSGLDRLITAAYKTLKLQSFLTAGELEVRAWTIRQGTTAQKAAGVIHTDFEKRFISAKIVSFDDFLHYQGWKGVKESGKIRAEGRDYIMQEGDVVEFMIGK